MFDYDWFYGRGFEQQKLDALTRVALRKFPKLDRTAAEQHAPFSEFRSTLECRTLIYLRDGFSYELKALTREIDSKSHLTFECEPGDEVYKPGAFVVSVPFEEVCRVEVFAVHPDHKPESKPMITGFRTSPRDEAKE